jgi:hypothetical protein
VQVRRRITGTGVIVAYSAKRVGRPARRYLDAHLASLVRARPRDGFTDAFDASPMRHGCRP